MMGKRPIPDENRLAAPTLERLGHARRQAAVTKRGRTHLGEIDGSNKAIVDARGQRGNPYRVTDAIAVMQRVGTISKPMAQAADQFRADFHLAALGQLKAMPMERMSRGSTQYTLAQLAARRNVHAALAILGGMASPAGSIVWHVVGCEESIRAWAQREGWRDRPVRPQVATGILVGALGALAVHYGFDTPLTE